MIKKEIEGFIKKAVKKPGALKASSIPEPAVELTEATHQAFMLSGLTGMDHASETLALADLQILPDPLPFNEAINYMASKIPLSKKEYYDLDDKLRFRAFTAGRLTQTDSVNKVRKHLVKALAEGRSLSEFQTQSGIDEALKAAGFDSSNPWYWETVYRTNMQSAYNTGRLMQYRANPPEYLEFIGIEDGRQTEICKVRQGTILPFNDSWWDNNYPPLHFNCRSTVRAIYKEEAEIREITAGKIPEKADKPAKGFGGNPVKNDIYYKLTPGMIKRAKEYGIDTDFLNAAVDANLADYARELVKEGLKSDKILFDNIDDTRLKKLAEESMNPEIPLRTEGRELVEKYKDKISFETAAGGSVFIQGKGIIRISNRTFSQERRNITFRHEFGHALDHRVSKTALSKEDEFTSIIKGINKKLTGVKKDEKLRTSVVKFITDNADDPSVSDLFCSITGRKDPALHGNYVHPKNYYSNYEWRSVECFANLFDIYCVNDARWKFLADYLPELTDGFEKLLKKI